MAEKIIAKAYQKGLMIAPRKVLLVASLVKNRTVADALVILEHTPKRAAKPLAKVIKSAQASAINNNDLDKASLVITRLTVSAGQRLKRYFPSTRGRALPFQRKLTNILVEVSGQKKEKVKAVSAKSAQSQDKEKK